MTTDKPPLRPIAGGKRPEEDGLARFELLALDVIDDLIEKKKAQRDLLEARGADKYKPVLEQLRTDLATLLRLKAERV